MLFVFVLLAWAHYYYMIIFSIYYDIDECITGDGSDYVGNLAMAGRRQCLSWERRYHHQSTFGGPRVPLENFPDASWDALGNKCR